MERPPLSAEDEAVSDAEWIDETDNESESEWEPTASDEEFIDDSAFSDEEFIDENWEVDPVVLNVTIELPSASRQTIRRG